MAAQWRIPADFAGVALVARGPDILLERGFGSMAGQPIAADGRFWIASAAKQFVAAAILRLADEGRLDLDDPLDRFFPAAPAGKKAITVRQLLSHTSGLGQSYASEGHQDRTAAVAAMLAEPLEGPPGSGFRYANSNYQLAAAIVEAVTGHDYRTYLERTFWAPLGMTNSGFAGDAGSPRVTGTSAPLPSRLSRQDWGGAGVYSSAGDLLRWVRGLRGGQLLSPDRAALLFTPIEGARISEGHATLGWFAGRTDAGTTRIFIRGNEDFGANSLIYFYPEQDVTIIVLTHAGDAAGSSWSRTVHAGLERALGL